MHYKGNYVAKCRSWGRTQAAQLRACEILPNCEFVPVQGARHDLYMEVAQYRSKLYEASEKFVSTRLASIR